MAGRLRLYALCGFFYFYQHDRASRRDSFRPLYGDNGSWNDLCQLHILNLPLTASWFYGLFLFGGALVHLALDELYSVNLSNMRMKRSSGTAMKFYQPKDKWWYLLLYTLLAILVYFAPPFDAFWQQLRDPEPWAQLKVGILPELIKSMLR